MRSLRKFFPKITRDSQKAGADPPRLSVIVIYFKMERQITNTLRSLLPPYQQRVKKKEMEILLVDNGSASEPLREDLWKLARNVFYTHIPPGEAAPNPGVAINRAVRNARGEILCIMIDGARMLSPGVLTWGLRLMEMGGPRAMVEVRGWHLGPKSQNESVAEGYTHETETALLEKIHWQENGYRLFSIAAASAQTDGRPSARVLESNCLFLRRDLFHEIGGYDERFREPGGGFVNLDFFGRAGAAASHVITLLGEGTFHQVHGGAATGLNKVQLEKSVERWTAETQRVRGDLRIAVHKRKLLLAGHMPDEYCQWLRAAGSAAPSSSPLT